MKFKFFVTLFSRIKSLKKYMLDSSVSKWKKLLIVFGIIYLVSPIDLIPEPVLGLGIIDDAALWGFLLTFLGSELDKYWKDNAEPYDKSSIHSNLKGKKIIEGEGRQIDDDIDEVNDNNQAAG